MASSRTVAKGIRISNESAEYFNGKPLNRMVESLMELLESGRVRFDGENLLISNEGVHTGRDLPEGTLRDIESMAELCNMTLGEAIEEFGRLLNDGSLVMGKEITVGLPQWAEKFAEVCTDKCLDVERVGESAVKAIERGML